MTDRLAGKVALVPGGAGGLGQAQVRRFVAEGAVVAVGDHQHDVGKALVTELAPSTMFVDLDVTRSRPVVGRGRRGPASDPRPGPRSSTSFWPRPG